MQTELKLSKAELKTLLPVGRKLELIACYVPMAAPQSREVLAQRSYGYDMKRADGKTSRLDFEAGQKIIGITEGNGFIAFKIVDAAGITAAHYRLM